ncbi:MAG: InlB B-repeat-containing protein [Treponema sp.]|nr:InlB B-repeat-containing protein [Treponema sp.]
MKKFLPAFACFVSLLSLALLAACSVLSIEERSDSASSASGSSSSVALLTVSDSTTVRSALPSVTTADFTSLTLTGTDSSGTETELGSWPNYREMTISVVELSVGSWTLSLTASAQGVVYSDTQTITAVAGKNTVSFSLALSSLTFTGRGAVSVTLNLPDTVASVKAGLYPAGNTESPVSGYAPESLSLSDSSVTYRKAGVPAGSYMVIFSFYSEAGDYVNGWIEYATITGGFTSASTQTVLKLDTVYAIDWVLDDGVISGTAPGSYTRWSDTISLPAASAVSHQNGIFMYWYELDSAGAETVLTEIPAGSTGNRTIYAKWRFTTLYVSEDGDDAASGSGEGKAKKTLSAALSAFDASDYDCTVFVTGTVRGNTEIDGSVAVKSLSVIGSTGLDADEINWSYTWSDVLDGDASGSVLSVKNGCSVPITLKYLRLQNGSAETGAGIDMQGSGKLTLSYAAVCENTASLSGGGIAFLSGTTVVEHTYIGENSIVSATSVYGAGVCVSGGEVTLTDCLVGNNVMESSENGAVAYGGGICVTGGRLTLSGGTPVFGGRVDCSYVRGSAMCVTGGTFVMDCSGSYGDVYLASGSCITVGSSLSASEIMITPETYASGTQVLTGSSALVSAHYRKFGVSDDSDGGSWAVASDGTLISTSIYVSGSGASADLGTASNAGAGTKTSPFETLSAAVSLLEVKDYDYSCTIFVSGTVSAGVTFGSGIHTRSIILRPYNGSDVTTAALTGTSASPVITHASSSSLNLYSVTVTGGAGGLSLTGSGLCNVYDCVITGNSGSGIIATGTGAFWVWNTEITANSATNGGGIYLNGSASAYVSTCEIHDNTALSAGGAVYYARPGDDTSTGSFILENCSMYDNTAGQGGGVYIAENNSLTMTNGIIRDNSASLAGNGVYASGTLCMGGSAVIDASNDVYLPESSLIKLQSELTGTAPVATITPASYTAGTQVLAEDGDEGLVESCHGLFAVTQESAATEWTLTKTGTLRNGAEAYEITYVYDGGSPAAGETEILEYTKKVAVTLPLAAKSGCIFGGWFTKADFSGSYVTEIPAGSSGDKTFYARWIEPVLYVAATGSDTYDGLSETSPLATVSAVFGSSGLINTLVSDYAGLNTVEGTNSAASLDWTVFISGTLHENATIGAFSAASVTLKGSDSYATISGDTDSDGTGDGTVLTVSTSVPVTITALTITDGNGLGGGGIYAGAGSKLTLSDGASVTANTASSYPGGGIYNKGTLTLTGTASVSANTAATGSGIYNDGTLIMKGGAVVQASNDVYLASGTCITIAGELTADSPCAAITPASYTDGLTLLSDDSSGTLVSACYEKFTVSADSTGSTWVIDSAGTLHKPADMGGVSVTLPDFTDITVEQSTSGAVVTFTAESGEASYTWTVDGEAAGGVSGVTVSSDGTVLTVDTTGWTAGSYDIVLEVQASAASGGELRSFTAQIKVGA